MNFVSGENYVLFIALTLAPCDRAEDVIVVCVDTESNDSVQTLPHKDGRKTVLFRDRHLSGLFCNIISVALGGTLVYIKNERH